MPDYHMDSILRIEKYVMLMENINKPLENLVRASETWSQLLLFKKSYGEGLAECPYLTTA